MSREPNFTASDISSIFDEFFTTKNKSVSEPPNIAVEDKNAEINSKFISAEKQDSEDVQHEPALPDLPKKMIEVDVLPEFLGAPYEDEVMMGYRLGENLPALMKRLDPNNYTEVERAQASHEISILYADAIKNEARWDGPLNKRNKITIGVPQDRPNLDEQPEVQDFNNNPPFDNDLDQDPDEAPDIDESELLDKNPLDQTDDDGVEEPQPEEKKKNWFQRTWQGIREFDKYVTRNRKEVWGLGAFAGLAGIASVSGGYIAAEIALGLAAPPLLIPLAGIAAAGLINYLGFSRTAKKWANEKSAKAIEDYNQEAHGDYAKYVENVQADEKHYMTAFTWADIVAKIAGGIGLGLGLATHPSPEPSSPSHNGELPGKDDILPPNPANVEPNVPGDTQLPQAPHAPEPSIVPAPEIIPHQGFVEHVTTANDTWDSLLGEEVVYSPQMIDVLKENHDPIIEMWTKVAANNGHNAVPVKIGPDAHWEYWSVEQMKDKLDWLIKTGYKPGDQEAQAWVERLDYWVTPGQTVYLPTKP